MTVRIEERLAAWATARDDAALVAELEALTGRPPDGQRIERARRLFARVLELPRGLAIMTIHALCGALLRRFPLEAGVAPHFETIDDRTSQELIAEARERVLRAARNRDTPVGRALEVLAVTMADSSLNETIAEAMAARVELMASRNAAGGTVDALIAEVYRRLGVDAGWEPPEIVRRACCDGIFDAAGLAQLATAFTAGGKKQQEAAEGLLLWLNAAQADRTDLYQQHEAVFLTRPRARAATSAPTSSAASRRRWRASTTSSRPGLAWCATRCAPSASRAAARPSCTSPSPPSMLTRR